MISVAIIDDQKEERERIKEALSYVEQKKDVRFLVDEYSSAETFLMKYEGDYDLLFMDILFEGERDGLSAAKELRKLDSEVALVFVTNMASMAVNGYEVDALDFILKPVDPAGFLLKMDRILNRLGKGRGEFISISSEGEIVKLRTRMIRYLTVKGHYVEYHSREGVFSEYITLTAAEEKLDDPSFYRSSRWGLVNLRYVSQITREGCIVDGEEIPVARQHRSEFRQAFSAYLGGLK